MAFEKMTAKELFDKFWEYYGYRGYAENPVKNYNKIGARMLRIELNDDRVLYFLWYDENNWNLGTKPFRNRPKKQIYNQVRKDLANGVGMIEAFEKAYQVNNPKNEFGGVPLEEAVLQMKIAEAKGLNEGFRELKTKSNEAITGCNQWENIEREAEVMANQPLEPINWVKEDPDVPEGCVHVFCPNSELIDRVKEDPQVVMDSYPPSAE